MLLLFCMSIIIGAVGYHVLGFSLGETALLGAVWGTLFPLLFRSKKSILLGLALCGAVVLGALRFWIAPDQTMELGNRAFTGTVMRVDDRLDKTLLVVRPDDTDAHIQLTVFEDTSPLPGDRIAVRGKVQRPEDFVTDTGRTFDYDGYLESRGVTAVIYRAQVTPLSEREHGLITLTRASTVIRAWIAGVLGRYIAFPTDGIVAGMLVGFQGGIPKSISDIFRTTGTLHTLVLSGYNITVLAGFLGFLLRRAPFKLKTLFIFIGITLLVLVSGAGVAAVRAGIMGSIALFAGATLSTYNVFRALLLAFLFFFFTNPITIFVDPGFHLSFLATFFIISLLPLLKEKTEWIPEWKWGTKETLLLAVGLPLFMLPYLMYFSGLFPVISPIANIIMVPVIPLLMLGGLATLVLFWIPPLATALGMFTALVGSALVWVLTLLSYIPQWNTPFLSGWIISLVYIALFVIIFRKEIVAFLKQHKKALE